MVNYRSTGRQEMVRSVRQSNRRLKVAMTESQGSHRNTGPVPGGAQDPKQSTYLVLSILCTVLFCIPFGIVAIVNSSQISKLLAQGDRAGAHAAAQSAKKWLIWGVILGLISFVIYFAAIA